MLDPYADICTKKFRKKKLMEVGNYDEEGVEYEDEKK